VAEDLLENYKKAYDNKIGYGARPALILVDFVEAYFDPTCDLYADVQDTLESALRVREAARRAGIPVLYTNVVYHQSGVNGGRFYQKAMPLKNFIQGSPMAAWPKGLEPDESEIVISK